MKLVCCGRKPHFLTGDQLKAVEENFNRHMKGGSIILDDFKKMMPAKNVNLPLIVFCHTVIKKK